MNMEIPNKVILKAHRDWGDYFRSAECNLIDFRDWLEEKWGLDLQDILIHRKPKGFYSADIVDKGKAALFMLKYYD